MIELAKTKDHGILMITSIELKNEVRGLKPFGPISLNKVVLLVGKNGAGKSRLLNLLADYYIDDSELRNLKLKFDTNKNNHKVINYSHYDALLQSPDKFILNVVSEAKDRLFECNYENTAMDALLYIYDMAFGYSDCYKTCGECSGDFLEFVKIAKEFDITIEKVENKNEKKLLICGLDINSELLSPGQRYLLRMAVVCFRNEQDNKTKSIFLLDEPEVHLHPDILIATINKFVNHFGNNSQFFIATHSLALMSHFVAYNNETTILWLKDGKAERFRSNTTDLINGMVGSEENRLAINNLISLPDNYACNLFAAQCCESPQAVNVSGKGKDPSIELPSSAIDDGCTVLDYGAGKGRFIEYLLYNEKESLTLNKIKEYYAFDKYDDDKEICKQIMKKAFGVDGEYCVDNHYFNDFNTCKKALKKKVDYILMVNVLHEIDVNEWVETFSGIKDLLKSNGSLIIVEREELTVGETPYVNGYVMLTKEGVDSLFDSPQVDNYKDEQTDKDRPIVRYIIKRSAIKKLQPDKVKHCLLKMQEEAKQKIQKIHKDNRERDLKRINNFSDIETKQEHKLDNGRFKDGISLAFWVHQYTNISLILDKQ